MKRHLMKLIWAATFAITMRACVLEPVRSVDESMAPQVHSGDTILVSKLSYGVRVPGAGSILLEWKSPQKGDLVVAASVGDPPVTLLRRITAMPGEKIKLPSGEEAELKSDQYYLTADKGESTIHSRLPFIRS